MEPVVEKNTSIVKPLFKKSRKRKWLYGGAAVIVVLGVGIPVALHKLHSNVKLPSSYIYTVRTGSITQSISTSGTIQPGQSVNLNFQGQSGVLKHLDVQIGQTVKAGQALAEVDNSQAKLQVTQAQASVAQAEANLTAAQAKLTQTQAGTPAVQLLSDKQAVARSQLNLTQAEQAAKDTGSVTQAKQQLATDTSTLQQDENTLTSLKSQNASSASIDQAQQKVSADNLTVQKDQSAVTAAEQSLTNAQFQVQQDQLALQSAEATLSQDEQPPSAATLQQAQAGVSTAEAQLQTVQSQLQNAQLQLSETTLTSPISGVVAEINGTVGETPSGSSNSPFIQIVDLNSSSLQVNLQVSESQIAEVKTGDPISVSVPAYPGATFQGSITQVYPTPTTTSNVTQYTVIGTVDDSNGDLKDGMTASVSIQTAEASNVVTVPAIALQTVGSVEGVYVVDSTTGSATSGSAGGFGGGSGSGSGSGYSGGFGGGNGSGNGGGTSRGSFAGGGFRRGTTLSVNGGNLPKNVHFQRVQIGLFGTNDVQVVSGLQPGEQVLIQLPAGSTSTSTGSTGFRLGGGAGGFGGGRSGGGTTGSSGGGKG